MKKIALIGMMGSGKSEIGSLLASNYGIDFIDMDRAIEEHTKDHNTNNLPRFWRRAF